MDIDATKARLRHVAIGVRKHLKPLRLPEGGYRQEQVATPLVDRLTDQNLQRLNKLLPWNCFTVDAHGRRFGNGAWSGKRVDPQPVPDRRIAMMDKRFGLNERSVLEIGCFEGVHTVGLVQAGADVTATDARIENVVKTAVRCACFDAHARFRVWDVETGLATAEELASELVHHVGVLYHLANPVRHLLDLGRLATQGLMLDTHIARDSEATETYETDGRTYAYRRVGEGGRDNPFSGMTGHAKWLRLDDLAATLEQAGFANVEIAETRDERNGLRVLLFAERA